MTGDAEEAVLEKYLSGISVQTDSLTLRRMAVDGLTDQAEGRRCPPAHAYAVCVSVVGRHGRVFVSS